MALVLTPETCRAAYEYLRTTRPFNRWKLPPGGDVTFKVRKSKDTIGWIVCDGGKATIHISAGLISRTHTLMALMAHEMVHLYQKQTNMENGSMHNAEFWRCADRVCKHHLDFDRKAF